MRNDINSTALVSIENTKRMSFVHAYVPNVMKVLSKNSESAYSRRFFFSWNVGTFPAICAGADNKGKNILRANV